MNVFITAAHWLRAKGLENALHRVHKLEPQQTVGLVDSFSKTHLTRSQQVYSFKVVIVSYVESLYVSIICYKRNMKSI